MDQSTYIGRALAGDLVEYGPLDALSLDFDPEGQLNGYRFKVERVEEDEEGDDHHIGRFRKLPVFFSEDQTRVTSLDPDSHKLLSYESKYRHYHRLYDDLFDPSAAREFLRRYQIFWVNPTQSVEDHLDPELEVEVDMVLVDQVAQGYLKGYQAVIDAFKSDDDGIYRTHTKPDVQTLPHLGQTIFLKNTSGDSISLREYLEFKPGGTLNLKELVLLAKSLFDARDAEDRLKIAHLNLYPGAIVAGLEYRDETRAEAWIYRLAAYDYTRKVTELGPYPIFPEKGCEYLSPARLFGLNLDSFSETWSVAAILFEFYTGHKLGGFESMEEGIQGLAYLYETSEEYRESLVKLKAEHQSRVEVLEKEMSEVEEVDKDQETILKALNRAILYITTYLEAYSEREEVRSADPVKYDWRAQIEEAFSRKTAEGLEVKSEQAAEIKRELTELLSAILHPEASYIDSETLNHHPLLSADWNWAKKEEGSDSSDESKSREG